ncbi:MAG: TPM domain-containing protein [Oscillospiraceae bacterium]|nr:TPM domain-containing protein [Oscillospiraceae bacterium]
MRIFKRIFSFALVFTVLFSICFLTFADDVTRTAGYHVYDEADLLSDSDWQILEEKAADISERYKCGLYIVTVDDFTDYTNDGDVLTAAQNIYEQMDFGYGVGKDGQMLLLSMYDRDFALIAYGNFGNEAFTDYGKDLVIDSFLDDFRSNDWYGGFDDFLDESEYLLEEASNGTPVDILIPDDPYIPYEPYKPTLEDYVRRFLIMLLPGSLVSLVICSILRSKSKTVHIATNANRYVDQGLRLYNSNDIFLHRSQTRRRIETENRVSMGSGGGSHYGGTTINSSGFSGKSGKF